MLQNSHAGWTDLNNKLSATLCTIDKKIFRFTTVQMLISHFIYGLFDHSLGIWWVLKSRLHCGYISLWLFPSFSSGYHLQAARDMRPHPSVSLDPMTNPPQFRSRNQSYMRAVSTFSQASCVSQVSPTTRNTDMHVGLLISLIIRWFCEMLCVRFMWA